MKLLKKLFIKNYENTSDPTVRYKYGITAGTIGIITNALLSLMKIIVGVIGNSITIIADAVNNLSDAGSSVVTLFGFKLSSKPADEEHPYGHARFEYIAALVVAMAVFAVGVLLAKSSIEKIITPTETTVSIFTYIVLVISILLKLFQFIMYRDFAKSINSTSLKATSQDSLNDIITTSIVLISSIVIDIVGPTKVSIDGIFGLAVSIYILVSVVKLIKEIIDPLLGQKPDDAFVKEIEDTIMSYKGALGVHDMMVHNYGAGINIVMVHLEVDARMSIMNSHELADEIEKDLAVKYKVKASIHIDPIITDNPEVNRLKEKTNIVLKQINEKLSFHDFRVVFGTEHTNIIFDVVVPFSVNISLIEITNTLYESFKDEKTQISFVIEEDRGE